MLQYSNISRWPIFLLAMGALLGFALALIGVFESAPSVLPAGVVAKINGRPISDTELQAAIRRVERVKGYGLTKNERRELLSSIIEERLLLQHGLDIGLLESNVAVRKAMVDAVMASVVAEVESAVINEADLARFYKNNTEYFTPAPKIHLQRLDFYGVSAAERAENARARLINNESIKSVKESADTSLKEPPNSLVPEDKMRLYFDSKLFAALSLLDSGDISEPLSIEGGVTLLVVVSRMAPQMPAFETIREQVEVTFQRQKANTELKEYLTSIKSGASIVINKASQ